MFEYFTEKQKQFLQDILDYNYARINILEGSVRSGKTFISLIAWIIMVSHTNCVNNFLMVGKTLTSLKRNCLSILEALMPPSDFRYSLQSKEARIFGRKVFLEGVNDSRAEQKIRGMTLKAAYCDEVTLFSEDFFSMLLSRLSMPSSFLIGTTNPDTPYHWLMTNYLNRQDELSLKVWKFFIDDNDTIPETIRNEMKKEYTGVLYERFILGKWVQAEGLIYTEYANNTEKYIIDSIDPDRLDIVQIGIDYGASKSKTAFSAVGFANKFQELVVLDEFVSNKTDTPEKMYEAFANFFVKVESEFGPVHSCYADWGGLGQVITRGLQKYCLKNNVKTLIKDCNKYKIIERINILSRLIGRNKFKILRRCSETIQALSCAVWKDNGENVRLDDGSVNIDIIDALEYAFSSKIPLLNSIMDVLKEKSKMLIF